jgi:hypothetical protein
MGRKREKPGPGQSAGNLALHFQPSETVGANVKDIGKDFVERFQSGKSNVRLEQASQTASLAINLEQR